MDHIIFLQVHGAVLHRLFVFSLRILMVERTFYDLAPDLNIYIQPSRHSVLTFSFSLGDPHC